MKAAYKGDIYECPVTVEKEKDMLAAVNDVREAGCNALVVFLGNFGPETPETLIAEKFDGPCMFVAAAAIAASQPLRSVVSFGIMSREEISCALAAARNFQRLFTVGAHDQCGALR